MSLPAAQIRKQFLDFFAEREHRVVPSSPVFPQDDPTLLFTNAGMNQFKDVFLGTGTRDYSRAADTQKCIRVSGKHNDLEEVGVDTYHHTFFEMLGNWSFGDYFKQEAITWAWELLTGVWKLPKERLWVTVFEGDAADGLAADEEAERIWLDQTDVLPDHVLRASKADNFWEMGETGPCGPCSEIHIDRGGPDSNPADGADPAIGVNAGNERFIELWNLVFMQYNRMDDGSLKDLPARCVDTGMGFERIAAVLQGKSSNYDTDVFTPLFAKLSELTGLAYERSDSARDVAFRVCADHVRAVTAALSDGALPSNTGRGYVLRRLIRRAARFGRQHLGREQPFLFELVPSVAEVLGGAFPEMRARIDHVQLLVREEEKSFGRTLGRGLVEFERLAAKLERAGAAEVGGAEAFELYATYGFPRDLVELMARERGLGVDSAGWERAEKLHQEASKSEGRFAQLLSGEELEGLQGSSTYHDAGERSLTLATKITFGAVRGEQNEDTEGARVTLTLATSPFYAESGGQVGDTGTIEAADATFRIEVLDTKNSGGLVAHLGRLAEGVAPAAWAGTEVIVRVDAERRAGTQRNHTATHLMHRALKEVLGEHVTQQGSHVGPERLRFDFSHPRGVSDEELERVEALVGARVFANQPVVTTVEDLEAARARGVTAMFGEKYEDRVRVLDVGGWSTELCGGTHVAAAGEIGPFVIVSERAVSAGVRRIEALTGAAAVRETQRVRRVLREAARTLKAAPEELVPRIEQLQLKAKQAKQQKVAGAEADVSAAFDKVKAALEDRGGVLAGAVELPGLAQDALRELGSRVKTLGDDLALALLGTDGERVPFLVLCRGKALETGAKAGDLARLAAGILGGGGGGKPDQAQGQGLDASKAGEAARALRARLDEILGE